MSMVGGSRQRLAEVLGAAFAQGLLSEQTHSHRLGLLLGPRVIDPQQLVGDLTLRDSRSPRAAAREAWSSLVATVRAIIGRSERRDASLLLALDRVDGESLLVGRHPSCDVVLDEPSVSRRHAQLTRRDGAWMIRDLASTNGTLLNGNLVGRATLRAGDVVTLGNVAILLD
jgi:hypothetical protein